MKLGLDFKGSRWFQRLMQDLNNMSSDFRVVPAKYNFYRIYWRNAYVHEVYSEMPEKGYDIEIENPRLFQNQSYYQEFEDGNELPRLIKNFVEGYWDSLDHIKTRLYLLKNDEEFRENAQKAYQQYIVK